MNFRVGQKVVCVETTEMLPNEILCDCSADPEIGDITTISNIYMDGPDLMLEFLEFPAPGCANCLPGFMSHHFRPVVERKTDISFAHEILRKATKPARSPAVALHHNKCD